MGGDFKYEELVEILKFFGYYNYDNFIETGTFLGTTISNMKNYFKKLYTIELSEKLYNYNIEKNKGYLFVSILSNPDIEKFFTLFLITS